MGGGGHSNNAVLYAPSSRGLSRHVATHRLLLVTMLFCLCFASHFSVPITVTLGRPKFHHCTLDPGASKSIRRFCGTGVGGRV